MTQPNNAERQRHLDESDGHCNGDPCVFEARATTADTSGDQLPSGMTFTAIRRAAEMDEYTDGPAIGFVRSGADMRAILARLDSAEAALAARDAEVCQRIAEHLTEQATHATNLQGQHPADSEWWRVTAIAYNEAARLVREEWS